MIYKVSIRCKASYGHAPCLLFATNVLLATVLAVHKFSTLHTLVHDLSVVLLLGLHDSTAALSVLFLSALSGHTLAATARLGVRLALTAFAVAELGRALALGGTLALWLSGGTSALSFLALSLNTGHGLIELNNTQ